MLRVDLHHRAGEFTLRARFAVPGGLTVLFGPSGAGKSLTLALLAGLARPAGGSAALGDRVLVDVGAGAWAPPQERRVGMVFQDGLLLPHRTVLGNVVLAARGRTRHERREAALAWLDRVDAAGLAHRRPAALSGGERQRVALARALVGGPRLLLLDEPFNALDLPVRRRLREVVRRLVDETGVPALFVTHDREEAASLADRVVFARPGRIDEVAERAEALRMLAGLGDDD